MRSIDANLSRCGEGLRVLEDICRFECLNQDLTQTVKALRNQLKLATMRIPLMPRLNGRSTQNDVRANDPVPKRSNLNDLITANIKRCTEACRSLEEMTNDHAFNTLRYALYDLEQQLHQLLHRLNLKRTGIYVISDDPNHLIACANEDFVPIVQYRNKTQTKAEIYETVLPLAKALDKLNVLFMVNDHADIAMACHANGVHIGQDDLPPDVIRSHIGPIPIIGKTTHSLEQGQQAVENGADYVSVGPIWDTPSKPNRPGIGLDYLKKAHTLGIPFVAIGGISTDTIESVTPYCPPLIGAIRSTHDIHSLWKKIKK